MQFDKKMARLTLELYQMYAKSHALEEKRNWSDRI